MWWYKARPIWRGSVLCFLLCLSVQGDVEAQGQPRRRGVPAAPTSTSAAPAATPQPLSPSARISLDQNGLSVEVQDQDLTAVVERIAALAQITIRHPEGMANRRVSIRFTSLPVVDGLKRLFRVAEVPGYMLMTTPDGTRVQRVVFLTEDSPAPAGRGGPRVPQAALAPPRPAVPQAAPGVPTPPAPAQEEPRAEAAASGGTVFDEIKSNAAARRLLSQMMHPNEQVRERAFEGLVRVVREDEKQRALMEFLEPLMEDLGAEDKSTQDEAREEIRKLLAR